MKKRLFLIIAVLFCVLFLIATAAACADKGDTGENLSGDTGENPGGDVTENPEPEVYYTVTFDTRGGSAMASVEVKEGAVIGNVTLPTKQCAEFVGFAEDANGEVIWDIASDKVTGNITLYAIWEDAHTWEAWETVSEPTCAAEGARKRICDKCGDDETERIPALGHDFEEEYTVDVAPGCFTKGSESRHCTRCDATTDSREIEALGHDFKEWAYDDTEHWKICSRCGGISEKTVHVYQESGKCECGATEITPGSEFTFNDLGEDTYSLAGYSGTRENIKIPATYNGGTVVSIESSAFVDCTGITSVIVPDSVTSIGEGAFAGCGSLESITIPFVGAEAGKTSSDTYQYPFGYIFGTDSYTGGTEVTQYYYGSSTWSTTSTTYYIPASLRSVTVTGGNILYGAFRNCSMLTSVVIPDSVTSIGESAFEDCTGLTSVTIGNSVTSIGSSAFWNCTGLSSVTIGNSVASIGEDAFWDCTGLTSVTIGNSVTSIGSSAFEYCYKLVEVYNKSSLNIKAGSSSYGYAGYYAKNVYTEENGSWFTDTADGYRFLYDGTKGYLVGYYGEATDITLPDSFTAYDGTTVNSYEIYKYAFYGNTSLTSVVIPDSVTSIGSYAFYNCTGLTSVTIGNSVKSIGYAAFAGCTGLTSVTIGNSVTSIGYGAFSGCTGLTSVTIPDSVTSIGSYAFEDCTGLTSVTIPDSVESIGSSAFRDCTGLSSVTIPDSVTSIGGSAFYGCTDLMQNENGVYYVDKWAIDCDNSVGAVTLRNGTVGIGDYAFYGCTGLTSVTIGNSVTSIGGSAFSYCTGLTSVAIPDSVKSIGSDAFRNCYKLVEVYNTSSLYITAGSSDNGYVGYYAKHVYTEENGSWFTDTADGYRFLYDGTKGYLIGYYGEATDITLPDSFTAYDGTIVNSYEIYQYAFYGNTALTSVTIPDSVTSIGEYAFYNCTGLTSVTIGSSVTSIGSYAFRDCTGLISVTIGNSVTSIGSYAFYNCTGLTSVTIPDSVTSIGERAFSGCTGLTSVTIGNSVTSIGDYAFFYCTGLTSLTIGNSVASIGDYAFYNCAGLASVTIPDSVTSIGSGAFYDCTGLNSVVFEDTEGWQVSRYSDFSSYTSLASTDLANASTAATYLKSTYRNYYWRKV